MQTFRVSLHAADGTSSEAEISVLAKQTSTREGARLSVRLSAGSTATVLVTREFPEKFRSGLQYLVLSVQRDAQAAEYFASLLISSAPRVTRKFQETSDAAVVPSGPGKRPLSPEETELRRLRSLAGRVKRLPRELAAARISDFQAVQRAVLRVRRLEEELGAETGDFKFPITGVWAEILELEAEVCEFESLAQMLVDGGNRWLGLLGLVRYMKNKFGGKFFANYPRMRFFQDLATKQLRLQAAEISAFQSREWLAFLARPEEEISVLSPQPLAPDACQFAQPICGALARRHWLRLDEMDDRKLRVAVHEVQASSSSGDGNFCADSGGPLVVDGEISRTFACLQYLAHVHPEMVMRSKLFPIIKTLVAALDGQLTEKERSQLVARNFQVHATRQTLTQCIWRLARGAGVFSGFFSARETALILRHCRKAASAEERQWVDRKFFEFRLERARSVQPLLRLAREAETRSPDSYEIDRHKLHVRISDLQQFHAALQQAESAGCFAWDEQWVLEELRVGNFVLVAASLARQEARLLRLRVQAATLGVSQRAVRKLLQGVRMRRQTADYLRMFFGEISFSLETLRNFRSHAEQALQGVRLFEETLVGELLEEAEKELAGLLSSRWSSVQVLAAFLEIENPRLATGGLFIADCAELVQLWTLRDAATRLAENWQQLEPEDAFTALQQVTQCVDISDTVTEGILRNKWLADLARLWRLDDAATEGLSRSRNRDADGIFRLFSGSPQGGCCYRASFNADGSLDAVLRWTQQVSGLVNALHTQGDWTLLDQLTALQADCLLARRHRELRALFASLVENFERPGPRPLAEWRALQSEISSLAAATDVALAEAVRTQLATMTARVAEVEELVRQAREFSASDADATDTRPTLQAAVALESRARNFVAGDSDVQRLRAKIEEDRATLDALDRQAARLEAGDAGGTGGKLVLGELVALAARLDKLCFHPSQLQPQQFPQTPLSALERALVAQTAELLLRWTLARNRKVCPGPPWLLLVQLRQLLAATAAAAPAAAPAAAGGGGGGAESLLVLDARRTRTLDQTLQFCERLLRDLKPPPPQQQPQQAPQVPPQVPLEKWCRTRLLLPLLPVSLHEPAEQLRTLLERRYGHELQLQFLPGERRLQSCAAVCVSSKQVTCKATTRPGKSLFETADSEKLSAAFKKRVGNSAASGTQAVPTPRKLAERLLKRVGEFPALLEFLQGVDSEIPGNPWTSMATASLMAALDVSEDEAARVVADQLPDISEHPENFPAFCDKFIAILGQVLLDPGFAEKLLGAKRPLPQPQLQLQPPGKGAGVAPKKPRPLSALALSGAGIARPPGSGSGVSTGSEGVEVLWRGRLVCTDKVGNAELAVSLLPLTKEAQVAFSATKTQLGETSELTLEGSLSMAKFRTHYEKAVHGKKRSLLHCVAGADWQQLHLQQLFPLFSAENPHALAFTALAACGEKLKVWLVPPEGSRFVTALLDVNCALTGNVPVLARPAPGIFDLIENLLARNLVDGFPWPSIYWDCPELSADRQHQQQLLQPQQAALSVATAFPAQPQPPAPLPAAAAAPATAPPTAVAAPPTQPAVASGASSLTALLASFKGAAAEKSDTAAAEEKPARGDDFQQAAALLREALARKPATGADRVGNSSSVVYIPSGIPSDVRPVHPQEPPRAALPNCHRFNNSHCDFGDNCRYPHVCAICRGGHPQWQHQQLQQPHQSQQQPQQPKRGWRNL